MGKIVQYTLLRFIDKEQGVVVNYVFNRFSELLDYYIKNIDSDQKNLRSIDSRELVWFYEEEDTYERTSK